MSRTQNIGIAALLTLLAARPAVASEGPSITIAGTVTLTAADGDTCPGEGIRVILSCPADGTTRTEISDERGAFRFMNVPVDSCSIEADVQGFVMRPATAVAVAGEAVKADLNLVVVPLRVGVTVAGAASLRVPKIRRRTATRTSSG